jgi:cholesterol oxidase
MAEIEVTRIDASSGQSMPVHIRLTRYRRADVRQDLPPVLMIHGYSASGTTFAHPTLDPGLMPFMANEHRRDVWILDLRSSCGMPSASRDWAFEDMGCEDIPLAVAHVCQVTGKAQVDIVAHCMGVAMLFMGLLGKDGTGLPALGQHEALRRKLWEIDPQQPGRGRIRRLVMSQVGPSVLLTPANIARSYLMRYVKQFIKGGRYEFRPNGETGLAGELLDRVLAALPYPAGEFERENPWWPPGKYLPWVGSRHRIDALFGRVFNLRHMNAATLEHIDDFFGPFSVDTVSQVMYFVRYWLITDRTGFNRFVDIERMRERLNFPMLSLHSAQNGLADVGTKELLDKLLQKANLGAQGSHDSVVVGVETLGHQDSLIGTRASVLPVFTRIATFLKEP